VIHPDANNPSLQLPCRIHIAALGRRIPVPVPLEGEHKVQESKSIIARMITRDILEAFLRCDSKAYLKSLGQTGDSSGYTNWEREVREDYRRSCQTRCRFIFQDVLFPPHPSLQEDLKGGKHHILLDCRIETLRFRSCIDAVQREHQAVSRPLVGPPGLPLLLLSDGRVRPHENIVTLWLSHFPCAQLFVGFSENCLFHGFSYKPLTNNDCLRSPV
jgi:hypothetical protein